MTPWVHDTVYGRGDPVIQDSSMCDSYESEVMEFPWDFFPSRYGIYERCRELVEAGYDVRQPDKENVTLLHWAAINNRLDLVK